MPRHQTVAAIYKTVAARSVATAAAAAAAAAAIAAEEMAPAPAISEVAAAVVVAAVIAAAAETAAETAERARGGRNAQIKANKKGGRSYRRHDALTTARMTREKHQHQQGNATINYSRNIPTPRPRPSLPHPCIYEAGMATRRSLVPTAADAALTERLGVLVSDIASRRRVPPRQTITGDHR